MKIVILGNSGFVGGALHGYLARRGVALEGYGSRELDLTNRERVRELGKGLSKQSVLVLAAAITRDRGDTRDALTRNMSMVCHVAEILEQRRIQKCVYLSSTTVYGDSKTDLEIREETGIEAESFYALAKYAGEGILRHACQALGLPLLVLRPVHIFGRGDTHLTYGPTRFLHTALRDGQIHLSGMGEELRDRMYIDDLMFLMERLIHGEHQGTYNLATGESHSFSEVAEEIQSLLAARVELEFGARTRSIVHQRYDISKLTKAIPDYRPTPLREALARTISETREAAARP